MTIDDYKESKIYEIFTAYDDIKRKLSSNILETFQEQSKCIDALWSSLSLLEKNVMINPECRIIRISHEEMSRNILNLGDEIWNNMRTKESAIVITPDATLGQPQRLLLAGIRLQIIEFLQDTKNATIKEIRNKLGLNCKCEVESGELYERRIDKVFRSLIYCNILVFS